MTINKKIKRWVELFEDSPLAGKNTITKQDRVNQMILELKNKTESIIDNPNPDDKQESKILLNALIKIIK